MEILEREDELRALDAALVRARAGEGSTILVSGEAGIGKTTLVERFACQCPSDVAFLRGMCDALFAPRPLGPLHDIALQLRGPLLDQLNQNGEQLAIFSAFLRALHGEGAATIVLIEDVHWADEATLDLIKFLGRRVRQSHTLLLLTYRDDEVGSHHPLWFALGELPSPTVERLRLAPLSEAATDALARAAGRDGASLYAVTGGNPFFVSAVLAEARGEIPRSVQAAVLARAARLGPAERDLLELASIFPTRAARRLLDRIISPSLDMLEACAATGLVRLDAEALLFRHDLARRAILDALPPPRARAWHAALLGALRAEDEPPLARIVHHARLAGDHAVVRAYAPRAAAQAAQLGAHREAVAHYEVAVEQAAALPPAERAALLELRAYEYYLTGQIDEAIGDREATLRLWRTVGDVEKEGATLRWLSRLAWFKGEGATAERYAEEAIERLATLPPGEELAMAYSNRAQLYMLSGEMAAAVEWGTRAIELAEALGATEILAHALNNVGTALATEGEARGYALLGRSLKLALSHGLQEHAARAYTNLASAAAATYELDRAMTHLDQGIAYALDRDLDSWSLYMRGWRARAQLEQGRWAEAEGDALAVLQSPRRATVLRLPALAALGALYGRRGDPRADALLDEALALAEETRELQRLAPVVAARAERAWLDGTLAAEVEPLRETLALARERRAAWELGELGYWLWRAGVLVERIEGMASPYALHIGGEWRAAAAVWARLGCPYHEALALSDGDEAAQRAALERFTALGALPAAERLRQRMRECGIEALPRGPRSQRQENPAGLTPRQWEVLGLLVEGLSDREIAARLHISLKTAGHHVSAVLGTLGVEARHDAALRAIQRGWFPVPDRAG